MDLNHLPWNIKIFGKNHFGDLIFGKFLPHADTRAWQGSVTGTAYPTPTPSHDIISIWSCFVSKNQESLKSDQHYRLINIPDITVLSALVQQCTPFVFFS
jgi:hypothetical protein